MECNNELKGPFAHCPPQSYPLFFLKNHHCKPNMDLLYLFLQKDNYTTKETEQSQ